MTAKLSVDGEGGLAIQRFIAEIQALNWSPATVLAYGADLRGLVAFIGPKAIRDIGVLEIRSWMASLHERNLTHKTIRRHVASARAFFAMLKRDGLIENNPASYVLSPKPASRLPVVPGVEEMCRFLDRVAASNSPARDVAILELLYGTGIKVAEIVALNVGDVDRQERWLKVRGKGKKERWVPYGTKAGLALERYLAARKSPNPTNVLFVRGSRGTESAREMRFSERGMNGLVKRYATVYAGNSALHPHSFRHAFATHLMNSGAGLREIQELMGHSSVAITAKYTHVAMEKLKDVYELAHPKEGGRMPAGLALTSVEGLEAPAVSGAVIARIPPGRAPGLDPSGEDEASGSDG